MVLTGVPAFWEFRRPCSCPYSFVMADQRPDMVVGTQEQAWGEFYRGRPHRLAFDRTRGCTVVEAEVIDVGRVEAGHDHPDCTGAAPED